jgi:hypothetical protein
MGSPCCLYVALYFFFVLYAVRVVLKDRRLVLPRNYSYTYVCEIVKNSISEPLFNSSYNLFMSFIYKCTIYKHFSHSVVLEQELYPEVAIFLTSIF